MIFTSSESEWTMIFKEVISYSTILKNLIFDNREALPETCLKIIPIYLSNAALIIGDPPPFPATIRVTAGSTERV